VRLSGCMCLSGCINACEVIYVRVRVFMCVCAVHVRAMRVSGVNAPLDSILIALMVC
jgi:hypothetical protein